MFSRSLRQYKLSEPANLRQEGAGLVTWDEVECATGYQVVLVNNETSKKEIKMVVQPRLQLNLSNLAFCTKLELTITPFIMGLIRGGYEVPVIRGIPAIFNILLLLAQSVNPTSIPLLLVSASSLDNSPLSFVCLQTFLI